MRISIGIILAIATISAATPLQAQTYDRATRFACRPMAEPATTSPADTRRSLNANYQRPAVRPNASRTPITPAPTGADTARTSGQ